MWGQGPFQDPGLCYLNVMQGLFRNLKVFVAASVLSGLTGAALAQDARLDPLFERLLAVDVDDAPLIEDKIVAEWSKSGSAAMDYLLRRAQSEFQKENWKGALIHLTALTDHAPEFAEGWHAKSLAHYRLDQIGLALDGLERALALEPRHFNAMAGVLAIMEQTGLDSEALDMAYLIKAIHPHFEDISQSITRLEGKTQGAAL